MKIRFVSGCVLNGNDYSAGDIIEVDGTEKGLDVVFGAGLCEVLIETPEEKAEETPDGTPEGTTETPEESTEGEDPTDEPHEMKAPVRTKRKKK